jgi:hypothetical protein
MRPCAVYLHLRGQTAAPLLRDLRLGLLLGGDG